MKKILLVIIFCAWALVVISVAHAEPADTLLQADNIFDTLSVDLKVNGSDGPVNVAVGERITISWESDGAKRCKGNWSRNDLRLNGKISGKLSRALTGYVTVRTACIDADGNREDDSVVLNISNPFAINTPLAPQPAPAPQPPTDQPVIISSCGEITKGGKYVLRDDVSTATNQGSCIAMRDISNVVVDCERHLIVGNPALDLKNVSGITIEHCMLEGNGDSSLMLRGSNIKDTTISHNIFGTKILPPNRVRIAPVNIEGGRNISFLKNEIHTTLDLYTLDDTSITDNIFALARAVGIDASPFVAGNVNINDGRGNKIVGNIVDGGSDGIYRSISTAKGADDGILWDDQTDLIIERNIISNVFDCGIEGSGDLIRGKVISNFITNAGLCGIGSWYDSSIESSIFADNMITDAPRIFQFHFVKGVKTQTAVLFKDSIFRNNKILNPRINKQSGEYDTDQFNFTAISGLVATNNIFSGNDFSKMRNAPYMNPGTLAVDDGTNICKELEPNFSNVNYPLACGR